MAVKSKKLNSNSILRLYKQNKMLKIMEIKSNEPKLTQKQICNQSSYSDSTIKRYRDDISMDSPYERNKYRKKNTKPNNSLSQSQTQSTKETHKKNKNTEIKKERLEMWF